VPEPAYVCEPLANSPSNLAAPITGPALAGLAGDHLFDLIAMLIGPTRDAAELAAGRRLRSGRLMAILSYVDRNISTPPTEPQDDCRRAWNQCAL